MADTTPYWLRDLTPTQRRGAVASLSTAFIAMNELNAAGIFGDVVDEATYGVQQLLLDAVAAI